MLIADLFVNLMKQLFSPLEVDLGVIRQGVAGATSEIAVGPREFLFLKAVLAGDVKKVSDALAREKDLVSLRPISILYFVRSFSLLR